MSEHVFRSRRVTTTADARRAMREQQGLTKRLTIGDALRHFYDG
jgi:hypothetical protein